MDCQRAIICCSLNFCTFRSVRTLTATLHLLIIFAVLQYQRRKRKSGDGDSPTVASPPHMPPYTPTLPPGPSSSLTSGTCEVQPPNHTTTTDKRQQLAYPPTASPQLPPGTSTPPEIDTSDGLRSGHPRMLTSLEGETWRQPRQMLQADGDEAQGAPVTKSGGKTPR